MKILRYLLSIRAVGGITAQRVIQRSVQHFESLDGPPFLPFITLGFGTPAQQISGILDTGSSDTIIPEAGSAVCKLKTQQCTAPARVIRGQFDPKAACDFKRLDRQHFNASFGGGDQYDGEFIETTVTLGDVGQGRIPNAQVALATHSNPQHEAPQVPVFGLGPQLLEATATTYENLPKKMKSTRVTKSQAYSIVLNSTPFANGSIFFGGIDRSKFDGELKEVPLERDIQGNIPQFVVKMSSLHLDLGARGKSNATDLQRARERVRRIRWKRSIKTLDWNKMNALYSEKKEKNIIERKIMVGYGESKSSIATNASTMTSITRGNNGGNDCITKKDEESSQKIDNNGGIAGSKIDLGLDSRDGFTLMDTGGVFIALPPPVLSSMANALSTTFSKDSFGPVECNRLTGDSALIMRFNGDTVEARVPLANMRISDALVDPALTSRGLCLLGVTPTRAGDTNTATLPFFAAVYTVFDMENNRLLFAQAKGDPSAPSCQLEEFP
ncbi:hypothetical protein NLG97_g2127 [Lecanicillium saksenae]|uniref:Uncharacterized protein n=1 Tax=Lecanicillium saksenae TaxID=468837 RepID=A0ACC1R319_9HYPO|nr:hypothetical protein NLG97_g2127 [Lecanicillium saksenae]